MGYPDLGSPIDFGWKQDIGILVPVYFEGQSASQFIKSLKCDCSHRQVCSTGCTCYLNGNSGIELCSCVMLISPVQDGNVDINETI